MRLSATITESGTRYWEMFVEVTTVDGRKVSPKLAAAIAEQVLREEVQGSTPDNCETEGQIDRAGKQYRWRIAFELQDEAIEWETEEAWQPLRTDRIPCQWATKEQPKARKRRVA